MPLDFPNPSVNTTYTDPTSGNTYIYANGSWSISNVLPASKGGTGFNTFTRGDILFGNASGTLSKLAAGTNGYVLSTNGSTADPTWIAMSTGGGAGTVATPGNQYQLAGYYQGTGASVSGSSTFTNNTASGIVSITHATGSTSPYLGALVVNGGVGIGGTLSFTKSQLGLGGTTTLPTMSFIGNTNNPVYLNVLENNALSFEGYHGQLLSISPDLTSGYVFTVGDISGIPLLRANANANITANEYGGNFGIGTTNPGYKLEINGQTAITGSTGSGSTTTGALIVTGGVGIGGSLNVNTANVVTDFNHTPNNTTIGGASGWVASTASTFITPSSFRYLNNKYIGIGGTYVYYSDDMINWSSVMVPNLDPARNIANITYGEGKYVFVQYYTANAGYSTNLTNWTNVAITYQTWNDVIYGNGRFVATVGGDLAAYSLDGTSWTSVTDSIALGFNTSLKFLNGYFYVTNANAISRSIDGIIWQVCNTPAVPYGLAYGNGLYVGGIYNSGTIVYSYDGLNFSSYSGSSFVHNGSFFYNGVYYLTTQNNNVIRYSTDGFNWTNSTGFPGAVFNLQYIKGFLYAGSGNTVWVTNATPGRFEVNPLRTGTLDDVEIGRLSPNNANFIDVSVNNNLNVSSQYSSTSSLNGALTVAGGVGIAKTSYFGQSVFIQGTTASGSTTTGALIVTGGVGIGGSLNVYSLSKFSDHLEIKGSGPKELRLYNSAGTEYTALKSAAVSSQNYTYTLPLTYGSSGEFLQTNGSGTLSWATVTSGVSSVNAGVGLSVSSSTGSVTVKNVRPVVLNLASGFTPVGIGTDYNILRVPEGKNISSTNYYITKVVLGVGITSSGTSTIRLEKSSGPHTSTLGFSLSSTASTFNVMSTDLSLLSGLGETSWTSFGSGYGTVATGDRVRLNFTAVDTAHSNFIVQMLLEEY